jgi:predicted esterase YcpF (UPF0227 family)
MIVASEIEVEVDDSDWIDITHVYDDRMFNRSKQSHDQMSDARIGLDLFLNETVKVLDEQTSDLTSFQREHLEKIVVFVSALADRYDRVMKQK